MTVRVVVADDHPMVRYGIAAVLADSTEVEIVGEAASGEELLAVVAREAPDVVLTDLSMPGISGVEAIARLRRDTRTVGVAGADDAHRRRVGVRGDAGRCPRLPGQGGRPGGADAGDPGRRRRGGGVRS